MKVQYVRFERAVSSPGYAGNTISKAKLRNPDTVQSSSKDELMDEMEVEGSFLVLRAFRVINRKQVVAERLTPITNCIDLEPYIEPEEPPKKGRAT